MHHCATCSLLRFYASKTQSGSLAAQQTTDRSASMRYAAANPGLEPQMHFDQLKRRDLLALLGGAASWPLVAHAQQPGRLPTVAVLSTDTLSTCERWIAAFEQR